MIEHKQCRPPRGVKVVALISDVIVSGRALLSWLQERPAFAFLSEDPKDNTSATIWIPNCSCTTEERCPRERLLVYARRRYNFTSVMPVRAVSAAKARGIKPRRSRRR